MPPIKPEEVPYELPKGWKWVRLPECYFGIGNKSNQIQTKEYLEHGQFPVIDQGKNFVTGYCDDKSKLLHLERPVIVFGDHTKNIKFVDFDFVIGADGVKVLCPHIGISTNFLYRLIQSFDLTDRGYARHFKVLNEKLVPLPPLPEQHRIVAKIDQLMARCDALEALRKEREEKRLTVHAAAMQQLLAASDSSAWGFIEQHFGELYSVKENVAELRKAILLLAVMGHLVPQDPNDLPASELLEEIGAERLRLVKAGKIKTPKPLPPIKPEEVPYQLPQGWEWVRVAELTDVGTGSTPETTNQDFYGGSIPWYTSSATNDLFAPMPDKFITEKAISETNCKVFPAGSLMVAMYGQGKTRGQVSEIVFPGATNQAVAALVFFRSSEGIKKYLKYFFIKIYDEIRLLAEGAAQPNLNVGKIKETLVPLPPLPEQHRIVARIDQLMALCDTMDQKISDATDKQTELLRAVMAQV
ncbi:restriction endonuclease subunit S [Comamonas sp. wu1-DMT]|uniref:restriction endonuclease subunit S n=1 Tax=Comamonas sp. wu1-DMT TaxID=3126390 RepID=UPI0032E4084C